MSCSIYREFSMKRPGAYTFQAHLRVWGAGVIETWGLLRDGVSLNFPPKSEHHRFFPKGKKMK